MSIAVDLSKTTKNTSRTELYKILLPHAEALLVEESDPIANLANQAALLREMFGFFWVGFYRVKGEQLVLGPFQGNLACTRIAWSQGVCGTAWKECKSQLIPDVELFDGYIACDSRSRSEVVIPIYNLEGAVAAVLDIDSDQPNNFSHEDVAGLEALAKIIGKYLVFKSL
jgi:GAF domain-containing protein